jgi:hypothetical protein
MKVATTPTLFDPVTVSITFETAEEYENFRWAMRFNVTVPKAIWGPDHEKADRLADMMTLIHNNMKPL